MRACVVARLLLATAAATVAVPTAFAQTQAERLRALEAKTDFYTTSTKKLSLNYRNGDPSGVCAATGKKVTFTLDPSLSMAGTSYAWLTVTIRYRGMPMSGGWFNLTSQKQGQGFGCGKSSEPLALTGTTTFKSFCRFDLEPGDKLEAVFELYTDDAQLNPCQHAVTTKLQLKLVNVGIHEPAD